MPVNLEAIKEIQNNIIRLQPRAELIVVTKNKATSDINQLFKENILVFGENRVQEAISKYKDLRSKFKFQLHLIGPLQTNKVELALQTFDTIQTIDRLKLVDAIFNAQVKLGIKSITKNFFIQVNIGNEIQKAGTNIDEVENIYSYCVSKHMKIDGLMCIPPLSQSPQKYFDKMYQIKNSINPNLKLSMGMSADYIDALMCKSDFIRVGSKVFS